eukprot:jgi/Botrbrau1/20904/Bobra.0135s0035.1
MGPTLQRPQKKKRWKDDSIKFEEKVLGKAQDLLVSGTHWSWLGDGLIHAAAQKSIHQQQDVIKALVQTAGSQALGGDLEQETGALLLLSLLLVGRGSRPLHRSLLQQFKLLPPARLSTLCDILASQIGERCANELSQRDACGVHLNESGSHGGPGGGLSGFPADSAEESPATLGAPGRSENLHRRGPSSSASALVDAIVSMSLFEPAQKSLRQYSGTALLFLAVRLRELLKGDPPMPAALEEAQDVVSAAYYLIARHGQFIACQAELPWGVGLTDVGIAAGPFQDAAEESRRRAGHAGAGVLLAVADVMLICLQGSAISREAQATVGLTLTLAAALPAVPWPVMALRLADGLFPQGPEPAWGTEGGHVEEGLRGRGTSLAKELRRCPAGARVCLLKGLVQALPAEALCCPLVRSPGDHVQSPGDPGWCTHWTLLVDGALMCGCEAADTGRDVHLKYQAICLIEACLTRIRGFLEEACGALTAQAPPGRGTDDAEGDPSTPGGSPRVPHHRDALAGTLRDPSSTGIAFEVRESELREAAEPLSPSAGRNPSSSSHSFPERLASRDRAPQEPLSCNIPTGRTFGFAAESCSDVGRVPQRPHADRSPTNGWAPGSSALGTPQWVPMAGLSGTAHEDEAEHAEPSGDRGESLARDRAHDTLPVPLEMLPVLEQPLRSRLLSVLWASWEDPLAQTVKQVHAAFELLLDVVAAQERLAEVLRVSPAGLPVPPGLQGTMAGGVTAFLEATAVELASLGPGVKGKYAPLRALVGRLGAARLLQLCPALLEDTLAGMRQEGVCPSAASLLQALLGSCRHDGPPGPQRQQMWRDVWQGPMLRALVSPDDRLRYNVSVYGLPVPLQMDASSLPALLHCIMHPSPDFAAHISNPQLRVAALVAVLKVGRSLQLVNSLREVGLPGEAPLLISQELLSHAVKSSNEALRLDALELACLHPRASTPPGELEFRLVGEALALGMRTSSSAARNKWRSLLSRLLRRVRTSMAAALARRQVPQEAAAPPHPDDVPRGSSPARSASDDAEEDEQGREDDAVLALQAAFLRSFSAFLLGHMYPGAPYPRKSAALMLLGLLLRSWAGPDKHMRPATIGGTAGKGRGQVDRHTAGHNHQGEAFTRGRNHPDEAPTAGCNLMEAVREAEVAAGQPLFCPGFLEQPLVDVLLGNLDDSWERVREAAQEALDLLPAPLPGYATLESVESLKIRGLQLLNNPRAAQADAGARMLSLLFRSYVKGLGWELQLTARTKALPDQAIVNRLTPEQARAAIPVSERAAEALLPDPATPHNGLLPEEATSSPAAVELEGPLPVRARPGGSSPHIGPIIQFLWSANDLLREQVMEGQGEETGMEGKARLAQGPLLLLRNVVPHVPWQLLGSCPEATGKLRHWLLDLLALGEQAAHLAITLLENAPNTDAADVDSEYVEGMDDSGSEGGDVDGAREGPAAQAAVVACWLSLKELAFLLATLPRHCPFVGEEGGGLIGVDEAQRMANLFIRILTSVKHDGVTEKAQAGFICLTDALLQRRSEALREVPGRCLDVLLQRLQAPGQRRDDITRRSAGLPFALIALFVGGPTGSPRVLLERGIKCLLEVAQDPQGQAGEPWPRVHALNTLCAVFNDRGLALNLSAFTADAVSVSVEAMCAPEWEVRNAARRVFSSLLVRIAGFKNLSKGDVRKRSLTAPEFFTRYPTLAPVLQKTLDGAMETLTGSIEALEEGGHQSRSALHPCLVLLSRLRPAQGIQFPAGAELAAQLVPAVQRCTAAGPAAIRTLAARALVPLLPPESVLETIRDLIPALPTAPPILNHNQVHGRLVQVGTLLEALPPTIHMDHMETHVSIPLAERAWLLNSSCTAPLVRLEYLRTALAALTLIANGLDSPKDSLGNLPLGSLADSIAPPRPPPAVQLVPPDIACHSAGPSSPAPGAARSFNSLGQGDETSAGGTHGAVPHAPGSIGGADVGAAQRFKSLAETLSAACRELLLNSAEARRNSGDGVYADAASPGMCLLLKEAAHCLFGPVLAHCLIRPEPLHCLSGLDPGPAGVKTKLYPGRDLHCSQTIEGRDSLFGAAGLEQMGPRDPHGSSSRVGVAPTAPEGLREPLWGAPEGPAHMVGRRGLEEGGALGGGPLWQAINGHDVARALQHPAVEVRAGAFARPDSDARHRSGPPSLAAGLGGEPPGAGTASQSPGSRASPSLRPAGIPHLSAALHKPSTSSSRRRSRRGFHGRAPRAVAGLQSARSDWGGLGSRRQAGGCRRLAEPP